MGWPSMAPRLGRVVHASLGNQVTVASIGCAQAPEAYLYAWRKAVGADPDSARILRQFDA